MPANQLLETDESSDHVIMALDIKERGSVGCAYYVAKEERLFCMEDVSKGGRETVDKCEYTKTASLKC
jgi:DNA mismatch repair protein MSH5